MWNFKKKTLVVAPSWICLSSCYLYINIVWELPTAIFLYTMLASKSTQGEKEENEFHPTTILWEIQKCLHGKRLQSKVNTGMFSCFCPPYIFLWNVQEVKIEIQVSISLDLVYESNHFTKTNSCWWVWQFLEVQIQKLCFSLNFRFRLSVKRHVWGYSNVGKTCLTTFQQIIAKAGNLYWKPHSYSVAVNKCHLGYFFLFCFEMLGGGGNLFATQATWIYNLWLSFPKIKKHQQNI